MQRALSIHIIIFTECTALENKLKEVLEGVRSLCGLPTAGDCSCQADPTWTSIPLTRIAHKHPLYAGTYAFTIPSTVPQNAKEVLVYVEIEAANSNPANGRSNLKVYTQEGGKRYEQYILVRTTPGANWYVNSDQMWFPLMSNRILYVNIPRTHTNYVIFVASVIGYR